MTARSRWDEMRSLIEAGWHSGSGDWLCPQCWRPWHQCLCAAPAIDWDDIKRAEADADRMLYGDAGAFMRGGEPGC
jgi:hypothetical protein